MATLNGGDVLTGLPTKFPLESLDAFHFGSGEARTDKLLQTCFCYPQPVREFLRDEKSVVIGQKGSGKSAVFRMLAEKKVWFFNPEKRDQVILPIEEELQYQSIRSAVISQITASVESPGFRARIVWEVFLLYRMLLMLEATYGILPPPLDVQTKRMKSIFGDRSVSLKNFFQSAKYEVKAKLEQGVTGQYTPTLVASVEPKAGTGQAASQVDAYLVDVEAVKGAIQAFLENRNAVLYVLIDKLDEFTTQKDYKAQRQMLQGLIECERGYLSHDLIRLKVFMRRDLFEKLDFEALGKDKVLERTVEFRWSDGDVREFLAKRLIHNLQHAMGVRSVGVEIDTEVLYLDDSLLTPEQLFSLDVNAKRVSLVSVVKSRLHAFAGRYLGTKAERHLREGRLTHLYDRLSYEVVTCFLPAEVQHRDANGQLTTMPLKKYLATHFAFSTGTTPRLINRYLALLFETARHYYHGNQDEEVTLNGEGEYDLINQAILSTAYGRLKEEVANWFSMSNPNWAKWFQAIKAGKKRRSVFIYDELSTLARAGRSADFPKFLAYLVHLGYLECTQTDSEPKNRKYRLPVLFRA